VLKNAAYKNQQQENIDAIYKSDKISWHC